MVAEAVEEEEVVLEVGEVVSAVVFTVCALSLERIAFTPPTETGQYLCPSHSWPTDLARNVLHKASLSEYNFTIF